MISEWAERSRLGRVLLSIAIVVLIAAQVASHLPPSAMRASLREPGLRVQRITTAEMQWGVFAPNPRATTLALSARIEFADGSTATWEMPQGDVLVTNLRFYRWRKWLERVRSDDYTSLWAPTAQWIASLHAGGPSPVTSVTLIRWSRENQLRGPQPALEPEEYYTLRFEAGE